MAYETSNPPYCLIPRLGTAGGVGVFGYTDGDAIAAIDATDYFTNAGDLGMVTGDCVLILGNSLLSITMITVDAAGAGTVTALTAVP